MFEGVNALLSACATLVSLTLLVGFRMLYMRIGEMIRMKIKPDSIALSYGKSQKLADSRASDNYNHLFEQPILFYLLCVLAITLTYVPSWFVTCAWGFVGLRIIHSLIQCSYNKVMHRFTVFVISYLLLCIMWGIFVFSYLGNS